MKKNNFAVFILTHGRPEKVITLEALRKSGYTGKVYLVCDDEDKTLEQYKEKYKNVLVFSKDEISKTFDSADNFKDRRTIVYARNVCFDLAKKIGIKYFIELDDDYVSFTYRTTSSGEWKENRILNINYIFDAMIEFYENSGCLSLAMSQGGDFMGGALGNPKVKDGIVLTRKAMNSFICSTEREFRFVGRINEDVNTYTFLGSQGKLFLTVNLISLHQLQTQSNSGGMTDVYKDSGTYLKSFYSVIFQPSSVKISMMGEAEERLHHEVTWRNTVPKIIPETCKKK